MWMVATLRWTWECIGLVSAFSPRLSPARRGLRYELIQQFMILLYLGQSSKI